MRIIYMGTPSFAVPSLALLHKSTHEIVGVITAPDKPSGRGNKVSSSPVKVYALQEQLPIFQPVKLRNPEFLNTIRGLSPDLMVVVAFRMLPKVLWSIPSKGTFNLHASLLPNYRGAAPINWAIIEGEVETGLTTFFIDEQIDTGSILLNEKVSIPFDWTAGDLHDELMEKGATLVLKTVEGIANESLTPQPQAFSESIKLAPKIFKEDCRINWDQEGIKIYHFIRGLSPYPAAWTTLDGKVMKVFQVTLSEDKTEVNPGTVKLAKDTERIWVAAKDQWLELKQIQLQGKKPMSSNEFLRGYKKQIETFV